MRAFILCAAFFALLGCYESGDKGGGGNDNSSAKDITDFSFSSGVIKETVIVEPEISTTINHYSTDKTPIVTHTGASYTPTGAITTFGSPITYTVTAEDNSTKDYQVTVKRAIVINDANDLATAITDIGNDESLTQIDLIVNINSINLPHSVTIASDWSSRGIAFENNTSGHAAIYISNLTIQSGAGIDLNTPNITLTSGNSSVYAVNFAGQSATVTIGSLNANDIYLVKVNTSDRVATANDTGKLLSAAALGYSQTAGAPSDDAFIPQDHIAAMEFNANPPPITEAMRQNSDRLASFAPFVAPTVGDKRNFWVETYFGSGIFEEQEATLLATGTHSNIWAIDNLVTTTQQSAENLSAKFDVIYPRETNLIGYEFGGGAGGDGGRDGDPKIQILVHDIVNSEGTAAAAGYFWSKDYYTNAQLVGYGLKSNYAEIFYLDARHLKNSATFIYSTLAHEFQHMINFNTKYIKHGKSSASWYNEMLSMMTEDVIGDFIGIGATHGSHPIKQRIPIFLNSYDQVGVTEWTDLGTTSYAKGYAFGAYLMRNFGGAELLQEIVKNDQTNIASITAALDKFEAGLTFEKALERYGEAMVFSGAEKPSGVFSFDNTVSKTIGGYTYNATGFDIWGSAFNGGSGPKVYDLSPKNMRPHSVRLHSQDAWKNASGSLSITLEKPADDNIKLYLMVR